PMSGIWTITEIAGKRADVYQPPSTARVPFAILFLHPLGLETLHDRPAFTNVFANLGMICVCPHTQRCWWTDRICAEFDTHITPRRRVLTHVMPSSGERWNLAPPAIGLLGTSMGGQGALRLAFKHPKLFPVVAAISAAIDYHERYGQSTPIDEMYDSK